MVITERRNPPAPKSLLDGAKLAKLGVQILNKYDLELECMSCHAKWSPRLLPDGSFPHGYWRCPNRCNWQ
jgi:hypothetical protein